MRLYSMIGYKLFKFDEDNNINMIRIVYMHKPFKIDSSTKDPAEVTIYDYDTKERRKIRTEALKDYTPIKPDAIFTIAIGNIIANDGTIYKDVIITGTKQLNIEASQGHTLPYIRYIL